MANRAINAKILKSKMRNKKRRFSVDRTLTPHVKVKSKVQGILSLNKQVRNQITPPDPYLDVLFPPHLYTLEQLKARAQRHGKHDATWVIPRSTVIKRYEEMVQQGETYRRVLLTPPEISHRKTWMHFNTEKSICFLIEINYKLEWMRRSYDYNSPFRVKELFLHRSRTIQWQPLVPLLADVGPGTSSTGELH